MTKKAKARPRLRVVSTANHVETAADPATAYYNSLNKKQRDRVFDLQRELAEAGFGKDTDSKMLACWREAMARFKAEQIGTVEHKNDVQENLDSFFEFD